MSIEGLIQHLSEIAKERPGIEVCYDDQGHAPDVERIEVKLDESHGYEIVLLS